MRGDRDGRGAVGVERHREFALGLERRRSAIPRALRGERSQPPHGARHGDEVRQPRRRNIVRRERRAPAPAHRRGHGNRRSLAREFQRANLDLRRPMHRRRMRKGEPHDVALGKSQHGQLRARRVNRARERDLRPAGLHARVFDRHSRAPALPRNIRREWLEIRHGQRIHVRFSLVHQRRERPIGLRRERDRLESHGSRQPPHHQRRAHRAFRHRIADPLCFNIPSTMHRQLAALSEAELGLLYRQPWPIELRSRGEPCHRPVRHRKILRVQHGIDQGCAAFARLQVRLA